MSETNNENNDLIARLYTRLGGVVSSTHPFGKRSLTKVWTA